MKIMRKKGQAAMEFLMTYGWAILVVLLAIGALAYFGVLSPQNLLPERTTFAAPLPNLDNAVVDLGENSAEVALKNNKGVPISLPLTGNMTLDPATMPCGTVTLSALHNGAAYTAGDPIANGDTFLLKWTCAEAATASVGDSFKASMVFDYVNSQTGQEMTHTGSVEGKYS